MRNILTMSEYQKMKETVTQKIKENNVSDEDTQVVANNLPKADNYQSRLLKLIPTEVVGVYIFINGLLPANATDDKYTVLQWIIFGLLFIINPFYLRYVSAVTNKKQILICTISFAVWVFSLNNSFMVVGGDADFTRIISSIILALYTLAVPIFLSGSASQQTPNNV